METQNSPFNQTDNKYKKNYILAAIVALLLIIFSSVMSYTLGKNKGEKKTDTPITASITPTPIITIEPTSAPTTQPTTSSTVIPTLTSTSGAIKPTTAASTIKTYTDNDIKLEFKYSTNLTVKPGKFTPFQGDNNEGKQFQFANKIIEISKDKNTIMNINFDTSPTGCAAGPGDEKTITVDALMRNTNTGEYIARNKVSSSKINYVGYSSSENGKGYYTGCGFFIMFTDKTYTEFGDNSGYFNISIQTNNVNQDWTEFDNIIKSIKRL